MEGTARRVGWVGEEIWGLLGFVALVYVWVYLCNCSRGCLCQGLQQAGRVYSWYSRPVSRCLVWRREG
jgi:hypothetical protein